MEDLLDKNIFDISDLNKLSPDYCPSNLILRMQMRRSLVKDTHSHGITKNSPQRRIIQKKRKINDVYNIGKEIAKIRHNYDVNNLKTKINFKKCTGIKNTTKMKTSLYEKEVTENLEDNNFIADKHNSFTNETYEGRDDVINVCKRSARNNIKNKIYSKQKSAVKASLKSELGFDEKENRGRIGENDNNEKCHTTKPTEKVFVENNVRLENSSVVNSCYSKTNFLAPDLNVSVNDLQSILIKMAICEDKDSNQINICSDNENAELKSLIVISSTIKTTEKLDFLNVIPLKTEMEYRRAFLINKYVHKWRNYVRNKKENLLHKRNSALNIFFDKLKQKKMDMNKSISSPNLNNAKSSIRDYSTYQHRYKIQKHIIALQKAKLEEQNKLIEELKYNKIVEASKQSVDAMREEVRKTYYEMDKNLKPKFKLLSNELKMQDFEEPSLVLHCLKVPQFLQRMEKRAREREEKHSIIRERRRQMEEERIRLKQQAELAKAEMDKEEKMRILKELRQKRKREKIENIRKKQHADRMRALKVMADLHYERSIMMKYGILAFVKLVKMKRDNVEKARAHHIFQMKKNVFLNWMWHTEDMWFDRNYRADDFHRKKLLCRAFLVLKQNHHEYVLKKQVADDYYELYLDQLVFRKFREALQIIKKETDNKIQIANAFYNSNVMFKMLMYWRTLPALNALKREQEARKEKWRQKVLQVVPDYKPPED